MLFHLILLPSISSYCNKIIGKSYVHPELIWFFFVYRRITRWWIVGLRSRNRNCIVILKISFCNNCSIWYLRKCFDDMVIYCKIEVKGIWRIWWSAIQPLLCSVLTNNYLFDGKMLNFWVYLFSFRLNGWGRYEGKGRGSNWWWGWECCDVCWNETARLWYIPFWCWTLSYSRISLSKSKRKKGDGRWDVPKRKKAI